MFISSSSIIVTLSLKTAQSNIFISDSFFMLNCIFILTGCREELAAAVYDCSFDMESTA